MKFLRSTERQTQGSMATEQTKMAWMCENNYTSQTSKESSRRPTGQWKKEDVIKEKKWGTGWVIESLVTWSDLITNTNHL